MPSNLFVYQLSIVVLIALASTAANAIASQSFDDEANSNPAFAVEQHQYNVPFLSSSNLINTVGDDEDSSSDEEYSHGSSLLHPQAAWSPTLNKRYASKVIRGESRLWAIPYRFGKRGAMPYRFGKRAGMHFRLGKKSTSL